jgi:hypothetical protein
VTGLVLALAASIGWGTTGMLAGRASRRLPPLHVAMRPKWQVMVLPLLTGLLALVKPIGQSLFITLMALARRLLPNEGCGLVRRFLTKRGLAFGADAEELCSAKRM